MHAAPISQSPPHTLRPFRGPLDTVGTMLSQIRGSRGERSVKVRGMSEDVVRGVQDKDYLSEILAIRNFVAERCRYTNDPLTTEWVKDPERMVDEIGAYGRTVTDCDEMASLICTFARQCGREAQLVIVGFGAPNQYSHVFARVLEPKSRTWIVCDPVAGISEGKMLRKVRTHKIFRVD